MLSFWRAEIEAMGLHEIQFRNKVRLECTVIPYILYIIITKVCEYKTHFFALFASVFSNKDGSEMPNLIHLCATLI